MVRAVVRHAKCWLRFESKEKDAVAAALGAVDGILFLRVEGTAGAVPAVLEEIGRASCRERV